MLFCEVYTEKNCRTFTGAWFLLMTCTLRFGQWDLTERWNWTDQNILFPVKGQKGDVKVKSFQSHIKETNLFNLRKLLQTISLKQRKKMFLEDLSCWGFFSKPQTFQSAMTTELFSWTQRAKLPFPRAQPRALLAVSSSQPAVLNKPWSGWNTPSSTALLCFQLVGSFPRVPGKEMKSSSQGKDPFPELLIFPYDIFWNTNIPRGGLLVVHESDQIGAVTLVHMLTIIQTFILPVSPPQLLLVFLMAPPRDTWNTSRHTYVLQGVMLYIVIKSRLPLACNIIITNSWLHSFCHCINSISAAISRIRHQIWFLHIISD